ncbi:MAG: FprA family A-type flavoprotein [Syntrophaceae bacterium]|nr:FprA family A-type flavoprotein [Syntrophaceae bacterium]
MKPRKFADSVEWVGVIDWNRRLFDSLIPLPDGTSYNAYIIRGSEKIALVDSVDPHFSDTLLDQIEDIPRIDYVIGHHAEQDHSGTIPRVLAKYPEAKVVCTPKGKELLGLMLAIDDDRFVTVSDGETISLGDLTLEFNHTPWVHWPETMTTYLREKKILFSCDFFGSHIATTELFVSDEGRVYEAAKRYFSEIMMPFSKSIEKNIEKISKHDIKIIAPSHGPAYDRPDFIINAYKEWIAPNPKNLAVIAYISMHGSTTLLVNKLVNALANKGVTVAEFDLSVTDIGKLAIQLVDAGTIVLGTPTVHVGPHPGVAYAAMLANMIKPKAKFVSVVGSYGWHTKAVEQLAAMIPNLKVEVLSPVICKGLPTEADLKAIEELAEQIARKHKEAGFPELQKLELNI